MSKTKIIFISLIAIAALSVFAYSWIPARASCVEPCLSIAPNSFAFTAAQGGANPVSQRLTVSEAYLGGMRWSTSVTQPWLSVAPANGGTAPGPWSTFLNVDVNVLGLSAGTYTGKIYVCDPSYVGFCDPSDPGFSTPGAADTADVTFTVTAPPSTTFSLSPGALSFGASCNNTPVSATCNASAANVGANTPVTFSVSPSGGSGSYNYLWQYPLNNAACANLDSTTNSPDPAYQLCTTTPLNVSLNPGDFNVVVSDTAGGISAPVSCPGVSVAQAGAVSVSSVNSVTGVPVSSAWGFSSAPAGATVPILPTVDTGASKSYSGQPAGNYPLVVSNGSAGTLFTLKDVVSPQAFAEKKENPFIGFARSIFVGLAHAVFCNALPGNLCSGNLPPGGSAIFFINWNPEAQMNISPSSVALTDTSPPGSVTIDDNAGAPGSQLDWSIAGISYTGGPTGWISSPAGGASGSVLQAGPAQTISVSANTSSIPFGSCLAGSPCTATIVFKGSSNASGRTLPQQPVTVTLTMSNAVSCSPASQTINTAANGGSATITASGGNGSYAWSAPSGIPASGSGGSFTVNYAATGTYNVGVTSGGLSSSCSVDVINVSCNFSANPTKIIVPSASQLRWTCVNANSCGISGSNGTSFSGLNPVNGSLAVTPTSTTSYSLTCSGAGSATYQATVDVGVYTTPRIEF